MKNCIFDFGNVLAVFDPMGMTGTYFKDPEQCKKVSDVVFDRLYWDALDKGTITDEEILAGIRSRLPEGEAELGCLIYQHWPELLPPMPGMPELARDLHDRGVKLYLLSDISVGFSQTYQKNPWVAELFSLFDGLMMSGVSGYTKPHREAFENLLKTYDLDPADCFFVDDRQTNIDGAAVCGIAGYRFDGDAQSARKILLNLV